LQYIDLINAISASFPTDSDPRAMFNNFSRYFDPDNPLNVVDFDRLRESAQELGLV